MIMLITLFSTQDYEINPRRRRGGEEMAPDAAKSIVSFAHSREPYDRFANKTPCALQGGPSSYSASLMSQAIIGSLPKGLDAQAKAKIQASVPASPSAAALKELSSVS